ncbi:hypothetical protein [Streptomyces sp. ISL-100]|uniref:hypothetical protein n=1 Tax=Streptomyces sp. ISL-100 TaxID=2819173 RepID=UPI002035EB26|nr:hypothetical protein [Streptomyces sp. ISL-100]
MPVDVNVSEPWESGDPRAVLVSAQLIDSEHPELAAEFEYLCISAEGQLFPRAVRVGPAPELPLGRTIPVTAGMLRDLPLARWESAARSHTQASLQAWEQNGLVDGLGRLTLRALRDLKPEQLVEVIEPGLRESTRKADVRRYYSLLHQCSVAIEYTKLRMEGVKDPAARMARNHDVQPATVRSWLHRARKSGILPSNQGDAE